MTRPLISSALIVVLSGLPIAPTMYAESPNPHSPEASQALAVEGQRPAPSQPFTLQDGTPVKLRLSQTISSADAKTGQEVPFEVMEDIQVNGVTVLPKGSTAIGVVTEAQPKRNMGRGGKLDMTISYARLTDGEKVALRAVKESKGGSHTGAMTGAMVATSLIIWPAAPFFLFMKGKDISIPQGTGITAFVDGDTHLDPAKFGYGGGSPAPSQNSNTLTLTPAVATSAETSVTVDSIPSGADIMVDGNFVGSTPSSIPITLGNHEVSVKKKGYATWTRKMDFQGGNVHLNAELDREN
jgi:hypothetical protein